VRSITFDAGEQARIQRRYAHAQPAAMGQLAPTYIVSAIALGWSNVRVCRFDLFGEPAHLCRDLVAAAFEHLPRLGEIYIRDKCLRWRDVISPALHLVPGGLRRVVAMPYGFDQRLDQLAPREDGGSDAVSALVAPAAATTTLFCSSRQQPLLEVGAGGSDVTAQFLRSIAAHHPRLETLSLDHFWTSALVGIDRSAGETALKAAGLKMPCSELATLQAMPCLGSLQLSYPILEAEHSMVPLDASVLPNLRSLTIHSLRVFDSRVATPTRPLARILEQHWERLEHLNVSAITDEDAARLAGACPNLKSLVTNDRAWGGTMPLTDAGFLAIVTSLPSLERVELGHGTTVNPGHVLTERIVTCCAWEDDGDQSAPRWVCGGLRHLVIPRASISTDVFEQLVASLPNLTRIVATVNVTTLPDARRLSLSPPASPRTSWLYENDNDAFYNLSPDTPLTRQNDEVQQQLGHGAFQRSNSFVEGRPGSPLQMRLGSSDGSAAAGQHRKYVPRITRLGLDGSLLYDSPRLIKWLAKFPDLVECQLSYERRSRRLVQELQGAFPLVRFHGFSV
ncbi:hypothetical protein EV182_002380, partial [Spiromyces aspiralis]